MWHIYIMKKVNWEGTALKDLCSFSQLARQRVGYELHNIQCGEEPSDSKPMQSIGRGVKEIRIHLENEYRVIYIASFEEAVYVLHAFVKKTQKTSKNDLEIAKKRYQALMNRRRNER